MPKAKKKKVPHVNLRVSIPTVLMKELEREVKRKGWELSDVVIEALIKYLRV